MSKRRLFKDWKELWEYLWPGILLHVFLVFTWTWGWGLLVYDSGRLAAGWGLFVAAISFVTSAPVAYMMDVKALRTNWTRRGLADAYLHAGWVAGMVATAVAGLWKFVFHTITLEPWKLAILVGIIANVIAFLRARAYAKKRRAKSNESAH